jgi:hypothetical protein
MHDACLTLIESQFVNKCYCIIYQYDFGDCVILFILMIEIARALASVIGAVENMRYDARH